MHGFEMSTAQIPVRNQPGSSKNKTTGSGTHSNIDDVDISSLKTRFETDGFVVISNKTNGGTPSPHPSFNTAAHSEANKNHILNLEAVEQDIYQQFQTSFQTMHENGHVPFPAPLRKSRQSSSGKERIEYSMKQGVRHGFREIVMRNEGRFELSLCPTRFSQSHPFLHSTLFGPSNITTDKNCATQFFLLSQLLSAIFEDDMDRNSKGDTDGPSYHLTNLSAVIATPGAEEQKWHADGGHLNLERHLPCHCLNVFVSMVDMSLELGPTEFRPGTHYHTRNLAPMILAAKARKTLRPPTLPILKKGDMVLFDYRILHRGKKNFSLDQNRAVLVMTFSKCWFKDVLNYPKRRITKGCAFDEDEVGETSRREIGDAIINQITQELK